jgi:hypothetical protein
MNPAPVQMPSASGLLLRLGIAALVGAVLTVCVIMPAEYRKDPTGFGKLTGLIALATPTVARPAPDATPADTKGDGKTDGKATPTAALTTNAWFYPNEFRTDTVKITLKPDGELEYKVAMKAGESMVYGWSVDQGTIYYDFHGEHSNDPKNSQRYREEQETTKSNGTFVAPFDGIHGWFWLNLTGKPQVVTLKMSGYYELHKMEK